MQRTYQSTLRSLLKYAAWVMAAVACAVALPQAVHALGIVTGVGGSLGQMLLPMYVPVLVLAFNTNAVAGMAAGALSPLISFALSEMPTASSLPFILLELFCFGLFAGLLKNKPGRIVAKLVTVQAASRLVRIAATVVVACFVGNVHAALLPVLSATLLAVPGYILQCLIVPCFVRDNHE